MQSKEIKRSEKSAGAMISVLGLILLNYQLANHEDEAKEATKILQFVKVGKLIRETLNILQIAFTLKIEIFQQQSDHLFDNF